MKEIKFKSRQGIDNVHKISPNEDVDKLIDVLNELADLGWNSNQWSTTYPKYTEEDILKFAPNYEELTENEKSKVFRLFLRSLNKIFFIESFGKKHRGYLRAEAETLVNCAEKLLKRGKSILTCEHKEWKYTHSNGFKTCANKECRHFAPCTIEEALANYKVGHVKINEEKALYFHHERPICKCGSHKVYYLEHSMFDTTDYQCVSCGEYLPTKYKYLSHISSPLDPTSEEYVNAHLEPMNDDHWRHRIATLGVTTLKFIEPMVIRYIKEMYNHYLFIEKGQYLHEFNEWLLPYLDKCIKKSEIQVKIDDNRYDLLGVKSAEVAVKENNLSVKLEYNYEQSQKNQEEAQDILKNLVEAFSKDMNE